MKKMNFVCLLSCSLLLVCCKKPYIDFPWQGGHDAEREKEFTLASMWYYDRDRPDHMIFIFNFHYNKKGQLDSIVMDPQVVGGYTMFRSKNKIDSVVNTAFGTYHNGIRINVRSGFEYDRFGNFISFNMTSVAGVPLQRVNLTYKHGQVQTVTHTRLSPQLVSSYDTFTYAKNDIVQWSSRQPDSIPDTRLYTYDRHHYNPLYFVADDLLAIFSGYRYWWEFVLGNEHVTTSKFYVERQQLVNYENYYDSKGRLIKKVFTEPYSSRTDSLTFHYVK